VKKLSKKPRKSGLPIQPVLHTSPTQGIGFKKHLHAKEPRTLTQPELSFGQSRSRARWSYTRGDRDVHSGIGGFEILKRDVKTKKELRNNGILQFVIENSTGQTNDRQMSRRIALEAVRPMELCAGRRTAPSAQCRLKKVKSDIYAHPLSLQGDTRKRMMGRQF
jgi:hypothetical protein